MFGSCKESLESIGYNKYKGYDNCPYCGSMNPVELAKLIEDGMATMEGSDWKYGWPHKFYVDIPNPNAGQIVQVGSRCCWEGDKHIEEPIMGPDAKNLHFKFYSEHLLLLDDETFEKVAPIISEACGITWEKEGERLRYRAPYSGYQK